MGRKGQHPAKVLAIQSTQKGLEMGKSIELPPGHLSGLTFVFSGQLVALSRAEACTLVEVAGGMIRGTIDQNTTHLVTGNTILSQQKLRHAALLGVEVIDEAAFLRLLER